MYSKRNKLILVIGAVLIALFAPSVKADAPHVEIKVVQDISGVEQPLGGVVVRWRNQCGGSISPECALTDVARVPRRYGKTDLNGVKKFTSFQKADLAGEYNNTAEFNGFTDPDYSGPIRGLLPNDDIGRFGCGQKGHLIAVSSQEYTCNQMKIENGAYQAVGCKNGWCEGGFDMKDYGANQSYTLNIVFKCKKSSIEDVSREVKRSEVSVKDKFGFNCSTTYFCGAAGQPTPTGAQGGNYTSCPQVSSTAQGGSKKTVMLSGAQSFLDKIYTQQRSDKIEAYIVECINSGGSYKCTTGDSSKDTTVFGSNNVPTGYKLELFKVKDGKKATNPFVFETVDEEVVAVSTSASPIASFFMYVFDSSAIQNPSASCNGSQCQATLSNTAGCQLVQDPYGRVFDGYTLEPLKQTEVTLSSKQTDGSFKSYSGSVRNPQTTGDDGEFSFYVPDGIYRLDAKKDGYRFNPQASLNRQVYDLYSNVYQGQDLIQSGEAIQTDIPLIPIDREAALKYAEQNPITIMNYLQRVDKERGMYVIEGRVSHPKATVVVYSNVENPKSSGSLIRNRSLGRTMADSSGRFTIQIALTSLRANETIGELEAVKRKITPGEFFSLGTWLEDTVGWITGFMDVEAAGVERTSVKLNPVLDRLSGIAYNQFKQPIPNATVELVLQSTQNVISSTTSDEQGHFSFSSEQVPSVPYDIQYRNQDGTVVTQSTSEFMASNGTGMGKYLAKADAGTQILGVTDAASPMIPEWVAYALGGLFLLAVIVFSTVLISHGTIKRLKR